MNKRILLSLSASTLCCGQAFAVEALAPVQLEEVVVSAPKLDDSQPMTTHQQDKKALPSLRAFSSDSARLLENLPGVSLYRNGGVSSLPVLHGLADERIRTLVDGVEIPSACGNHMNPPLSNIDSSSVDSVSVGTGITPVSSGGDSIAGTIEVHSAPPLFAKPGQGVLTKGKAFTFNRSNGQNLGGGFGATLASDKASLNYEGSTSRAGDYTNGYNQKVKSTSFATENHLLKLAAQGDNHLLTLQLGAQIIPYQDFVNAHMDMTGNQTLSAKGGYEGYFSWGKLESQLNWANTRHSMNVRGDKNPPKPAGMNMPMETDGTTTGYKIMAELKQSKQDTFRVGNELVRFRLDDWWPPSPAQANSACNTKNVNTATCSMAPGTLSNINEGKRDRLGTFAEWDARWNQQWSTVLGVRNDIVWMDADNVYGYNMNPAATNSAAYYADAMAFNSRDHKRTDINFDLTALVRHDDNATSSYELGYARKTRSPNLYERYSWINRSMMSIRMNGWSGDANGYSGNIDLKPEVANTVSATADWHDRTRKERQLKITPYFTQVQNFIDADRCPVLIGGNGCSAANRDATTGLVQLQYANHDAQLHGVDLSGRTTLAKNAALGQFALSGVAGYVRGKNLDTHTNLYNIMPFNARLSLEHERDNWSNGLEWQIVDSKDRVSSIRNEQRTDGYGLVNAKTGYRWEQVRLDAGIDNVLNKFYNPPLGGAYWVQDATGKTPVPGMGRSLYLGMTVEF